MGRTTIPFLALLVASVALAQPKLTTSGVLASSDGGVTIRTANGDLKTFRDVEGLADVRFEHLPVEFIASEGGVISRLEIEPLSLWGRRGPKLRHPAFKPVDDSMKTFALALGKWKPDQGVSLEAAGKPVLAALSVAFDKLKPLQLEERSSIIDQYISVKRTVRASAIYGHDDAAPPQTYREIYETTSPVGGLALANGQGDRPFCSGVLITSELLLTARHCIKNATPSQLELWLKHTSEPGLTKLALRVERELGDSGFTGGEMNDFALLRLVAKAPATIKPACLSLKTLHRGEQVYLVGHPLKETMLVFDNAFVLFPHLVDDAERQELQLAVEAEIKLRDDPDAEATLRSFLESYVKLADGRWEQRSRRWKGQPTIAVDTDSSHGNSGSPLFTRNKRSVAGLLFAGELDLSEPYAPGWKAHEAIIPMTVIARELDRAWPSWRTGVCFEPN